MKTLYLTDGSRRIGPFDYDQILAMYYKCQIGITDKVFDSESKEWVPLNQLANRPRPASNFDETQSRRVSSHTQTRTKTSTQVRGLTPVANVYDEAEAELEGSAVAGLVNRGLGGQFNNDPVPSKAPYSNTSTANTSTAKASSAKAAPAAAAAKILEQGFRPAKKNMQAEETQLAGNPLNQKAPNPGPTVQWQLKKQGSLVKGPLSYIQVVAIIAAGEIQEFDQIRKVGSQDWTTCPQVEDFTIEKLKSLKIESARMLVERGGLRRNHPRLDVNEVVRASLGEDSYHVLMGDISEGGCSLISSEPIFQPKDMVYLSIFSSFERGDTDFNAQAEILKRIAMKNEDGSEDFKYSVRFTALTAELLGEIKNKMVTK